MAAGLIAGRAAARIIGLSGRFLRRAPALWRFVMLGAALYIALHFALHARHRTFDA